MVPQDTNAKHKPPLSKKKRKERRTLLRSMAVGTGVVGASMLGFFPVLKKWHHRLRPPGAIPEHNFLAACIKCGQCVQVCPVEAIYPEEDLPEQWKSFIEINANYYQKE